MYKIFHSSIKLIANYSDIDKAFGSMDQSAVRKKSSLREEWIAKTIVKYGFKIFEC